MSKKELDKRIREVIRRGTRKILLSDEFREYKDLVIQLPNKAPLTLIIYIAGMIFAPRLLLLYYTYIFIRFLVRIAKFILEIEEEENVKILG